MFLLLVDMFCLKCPGKPIVRVFSWCANRFLSYFKVGSDSRNNCTWICPAALEWHGIKSFIFTLFILAKASTWNVTRVSKKAWVLGCQVLDFGPKNDPVCLPKKFSFVFLIVWMTLLVSHCQTEMVWLVFRWGSVKNIGSKRDNQLETTQVAAFSKLLWFIFQGVLKKSHLCPVYSSCKMSSGDLGCWLGTGC